MPGQNKDLAVRSRMEIFLKRKTRRRPGVRAARRRLVPAAAALLMLTVLAPPAGAAPGPPEGTLVATLEPPNTKFEAMLTDPDGNTLTYEWEASVECGTFEPGVAFFDPNKATWHHPQGEPPEGCPHEGTNHYGVITVRVTDGTGYQVTCAHFGSQSGTDGCETTRTPEETCPGFERDNRKQLRGTDGPDIITGSSEDEIICGLGGIDELNGGGGTM